MDHKEFLLRFGLAKNAADLFGVTERDIGHWKIRGIPARHWPLAEEIAKRHGIKCTAKMLASSRASAEPSIRSRRSA